MLRELYDGKIIPGEWQNRQVSEQNAIITKIDETVEYITGLLSDADNKRFQEMLTLRADLSISSDRETFVHGFAMGVAVMVDVGDEVKAMEFLQKTE